MANLYLAQVISAIVGIATSFYLLIQHTRLTHGIQDGASFCSLGRYADCDVVNASQYAELLGIPLATWGASFFFLLLALLFIAPPRDKNFRFFQGILAWLACFGISLDVVYLVIQLVKLNTVCLMCLLTYVCNGVILFCIWKLAPKVPSRFKEILSAIQKGHPKWTAPRIALSLVTWVLFTVVLLLIPAQVLKKSANYAHADQAIVQFYDQWKDKPSKKLEAIEGNGTWGNPNAKTVIVVFSDFECPFCRKAAFTLHAALKPYEERVFFVFKNFPLDSTCNPALPYQIHAHACKLARLATCGANKGKFWDVHDELFLDMSDEDMKKGFDHISSRLKGTFSESEIQQCLQDPKIGSLVLEDIKLGQSLNVRGTPTTYINGKLVSIPITADSLRRLIELEESLVK